MEYLTKVEVQDILAVYRAFCGDGRVLTDLELSILRKLEFLSSDLLVPFKRMTLEEFKKDYPNVEC